VQEGGLASENIRQIVTDEVLPRLQRIDGVADATVTGGREREIQVLLDADALKARRVAPQQVISTVVAESFTIPGGSVEQEGANLLLRTPGNFNTVEDIANLQIATPMGAVRVGDVAVVQDGFKKQDKFSRLNGQEAVIVSVRKQSGTNTVQVAERVRDGLDDVRDVRPDLNLVIVQDQSEFVEESFNDAMRELLIGALMASVVVWLFFRNVRNTLVTIAGLPIIVLGTFAAMNFLGLTLNIVSLLALSLSVGLIIDDAIVVRENIFRHMEMGQSPKEASSKGTAEVALPVVAMTLTIVAVFLPIAFTGGLIGRFMNSFGLVVSIAVLISLVEAMTFAPMLSAYLFKQQKPKYAPDGDAFEAEYSGAMGWLDRGYLKVLGWTLGHRAITLAASVGILVLSLFGASFLKPAFMPTVDQGMAGIDLLLPPGTALSETDSYARQVEARLLGDNTVDAVLASIGGLGAPEQANFLVTLKPGVSSLAFVDAARANMSDIPGLSFNPPSFTSMASGGASSGMLGRPVQLTLQTIGDPDELNRFALQMAEQLKQVPGLVDVDVSYKPGKPEVLIVVDRRKAADLGINVGAVGSTIRTLVEGSDVATFRGDGVEADIRVQLQQDDRQKLDQLLDLQVPTQRGFVPLRQIAHLEAASGPTQLTRVDRQHSVVIGANTSGRAEADVVADATAVMDAAVFPAGASYELTGQQEMQNDAFRSMGLAMLLSVVFVYMVLASQFGSFIQPFVIMLALPLAVIGGLLALLVFNMPLDMTALIGLMLLMGLVTKNSILLVDLTNRLRREEGMARNEALMHAGPIRLRPILMTTLALILGMLPVAIGLGSGSDFRQPMALVVIGGLITSTILTLVVVPTAYSLVEGGMERLQRTPAPAVPVLVTEGVEAGAE
jgi:HAE1 family hydrophobic/amphiphilic exporter-1